MNEKVGYALKKKFVLGYIELLIYKKYPSKVYCYHLLTHTLLEHGVICNVLRVYTYTDVCTVISKFENTCKSKLDKIEEKDCYKVKYKFLI